MNDAKGSPVAEPWSGFCVENPAEAFQAYCHEEIPRARETDADFDPAAYEQAVALVLAHLRRVTEVAPPADEEEEPVAESVGQTGEEA